MSCESRNQDLLLLAHGELGGLRRALLERHLRRCPRCQEQKARYGAVSRAMAAAVRGDALPAWSVPASAREPERARSGALRWALITVLALLLGVAVAGTATWLPEQRDRRDAVGPAHSKLMPIGQDESCARCHSNLPANHPGAPALSWPRRK
jgi:anti-sigma factor RsiW